ncbi:MAG: acetate--CoA ligase family protein [Chloroflexi bacterium]|nr:acetate--CoA ligase family protein [Chloroflexota bacterium]
MTTVSELVGAARAAERAVLTEEESKRLLREAGIPVTETRLAASRRAAQATAKELGFPVVLKLASPDITHKSDVGGVRLSLKSASEVGKAYDEILASAREKAPRARIQGVTVQPMAPPGVEVIAGMSKDPQFGPVLMFGLGGVAVEVLKDVAFRIVPLTRRDAAQMIREIKSYPLLTGFRSIPPVDLKALEEILLRLSELADATPELAEIDLNPIVATQSGAVAVDARVVLEPVKEG